jgi:pimeloyl-ACP methyl ester carboxylesterase
MSWVWRLVRWGLAALVVYGVWWYGTAVWNGTEELRDDVFVASLTPQPSEALVLDAGAGTITLSRTGDTQVDGAFGLDAASGYGVTGSIISLSEDRVIRELTSVDGRIASGDTVQLDPFLLPEDVGISVTDVALAGAEGAVNPAWLASGDGSIWIIHVHGRGSAGRAEANRLLPLFGELGYPVLAITVRGDGVAPRPVAEGEVALDRWGLDEWPDVEAAVRYALSNGAERYVLLANDQGASVASIFLHRSPALAARAGGAIFDSPVLDVRAIADKAARERDMPTWIAGPAKALLAFRFDVRWSDLNQASRASEFKTPILILHGTADVEAPIGPSIELAEARPDLVTLEAFEGVGHLFAWNADRSRYQEAIARFLTEVENAPPATLEPSS